MIKELELNHFTVFEKASFVFGKKLNIIVGGNGTGKSHILKLLYAWEQGVFIPNFDKLSPKNIPAEKYFKVLFKCDDDLHDLLNYNLLKRPTEVVSFPEALIGDNGAHIKIHQASVKIIGNEGGQQLISEMFVEYPYKFDIKTFKKNKQLVLFYKIPDKIPENGLFLQAREMLTLYPSFLSLSQKYILPYDVTYEDTIGKLGIPYLKEEPSEFAELIHFLEQNIHGKIYLKNERFYYHADDAPQDLEQDVNMLAEGWRKLGEIIQLLRNGELKKGMALFWDEPEANLNPQYIRIIAEVIIKLTELDIQIFIATQSLFLLDELEVLIAERKLHDGIRYFNLQKGQPVQQGNSLSDLKNVLLIDEDLKLSDRYFAKEK